MNNNKLNPNHKVMKQVREEVASKTKEKLSPSIDIEAVVRNGETRTIINNLAKSLIDSTNRNF